MSGTVFTQSFFNFCATQTSDLWKNALQNAADRAEDFLSSSIVNAMPHSMRVAAAVARRELGLFSSGEYTSGSAMAAGIYSALALSYFSDSLVTLVRIVWRIRHNKSKTGDDSSSSMLTRGDTSMILAWFHTFVWSLAILLVLLADMSSDALTHQLFNITLLLVSLTRVHANHWIDRARESKGIEVRWLPVGSEAVSAAVIPLGVWRTSNVVLGTSVMMLASDLRPSDFHRTLLDLSGSYALATSLLAPAAETIFSLKMIGNKFRRAAWIINEVLWAASLAIVAFARGDPNDVPTAMLIPAGDGLSIREFSAICLIILSLALALVSLVSSVNYSLRAETRVFGAIWEKIGACKCRCCEKKKTLDDYEEQELLNKLAASASSE